MPCGRASSFLLKGIGASSVVGGMLTGRPPTPWLIWPAKALFTATGFGYDARTVRRSAPAPIGSPPLAPPHLFDLPPEFLIGNAFSLGNLRLARLQDSPKLLRLAHGDPFDLIWILHGKEHGNGLGIARDDNWPFDRGLQVNVELCSNFFRGSS